MSQPDQYQTAILRNADWFINHETREGWIDVDGDEFYGLRGDATLVGHSVTVRCLAWMVTDEKRYLQSARNSLKWLAERQDAQGGWRGNSAFTLDGAQCVFEGFNTYRNATGDTGFDAALTRAADRMIRGTLGPAGELLLPNIIEIGEYAHFSLLVWKTTQEPRFFEAAMQILAHIERNFEATQGYWLPFDRTAERSDLLARLARPFLRAFMLGMPVRGRIIARIAGHMAPLAVTANRPQYAMNLMDAEALIDTLDGSCTLPELRQQTAAAIRWAETRCAGPFPGSLTEAASPKTGPPVYPVPILNDTEMAALWPTTCLLIAYCGMNDPRYADRARQTAEWIVSVQDSDGGFANFQRPDGSFLPLQSGNVNYYACIALWLFGEVYGGGRPLITAKTKTAPFSSNEGNDT